MSTLLHCTLMILGGIALTGIAVAWIVGSVRGLQAIALAMLDRRWR